MVPIDTGSTNASDPKEEATLRRLSEVWQTDKRYAKREKISTTHDARSQQNHILTAAATGKRQIRCICIIRKIT